MMERTKTFLLSEPMCGSECCASHGAHATYDGGCAYQVAWSINPYMKVGGVDFPQALAQHDQLRETLVKAGATVVDVPFVHGAYDSVFVKDNAILIQKGNNKRALFGHFKESCRQAEQFARRNRLVEMGFEIKNLDETFEGGDFVMVPGNEFAFLGYGFRSEKEAALTISHQLGIKVETLELRDPHFYHLDTALAVLSGGNAFTCRDAFTDEAWAKLLNCEAITSLTEISRAAALKFSLNCVEVGETVLLGAYSPEMMLALKALGKNVAVVPLDQFQLAGGSVACLTSQIHSL